MEDAKKIYQSSLTMPEQDNTDETTEDIVKRNFLEYQYQELVNLIGTIGFKYTYYNFVDDLKNSPVNKQKNFCRAVLNKIKEVYNFEFFQNFNFNDTNEIIKLYEFIEYLEFKYVNFLASVLKSLKGNDIKREFLYKDIYIAKEKIVEIIDRLSIISALPRLFIIFLASQGKENLINNFYFMLRKYEDDILYQTKINQISE